MIRRDKLRPYPCRHCDNVFPTASNREAHHRQTHASEKDESLDVKPIIESSGSPVTQNQVGDNKPFECPTCGKKFSHKRYLKNHMGAHSGEHEKHECSICGQKFSHKKNLSRHMGTHSGETSLCECSTCGRKLSSKQALKVHIAIHSMEKPWGCSTCGKRLSSKQALKTHMSTHSVEKPWECSTCGRRYSLAIGLQRHSKIHSQDLEKMWECSVCGKKVLTPQGRTKHEVTHRGEKPWECSTCGRTFALELYLKTHVRNTHSDRSSSRAANQCPLCCQQFQWPGRLRNHLLVHTEDSDWRCQTCNCGFRTRMMLRQHLTLNHTILGL